MTRPNFWWAESNIIRSNTERQQSLQRPADKISTSSISTSHHQLSYRPVQHRALNHHSTDELLHPTTCRFLTRQP